MNSIESLAEVKRARAERIAVAAGHEARQVGLAFDHFGRWIPVGPFRHPGDTLGARPGEALTPNADAVAHRLAVAQNEIKIGIGRVDH